MSLDPAAFDHLDARVGGNTEVAIGNARGEQLDRPRAHQRLVFLQAVEAAAFEDGADHYHTQVSGHAHPISLEHVAEFIERVMEMHEDKRVRSEEDTSEPQSR